MSGENAKAKAPKDVLKEATIVAVPVNNKYRVLRYTVWDPGSRVEMGGLAYDNSIIFEDEELALEEAKKWAKEIHESTGAYVEVLETVITETFGEKSQ